MTNQTILWIVFYTVVASTLFVDLGAFHKNPHKVGMKEAIAWSSFWIIISILFNLLVYLFKGKNAGVQFLTAYLVEKSLSVDNVFVFLLIFKSFRIPAQFQHRILFWGVIGAFLMRAAFILSGIAVLQKAHWVIYVFGLVLIISSIKLLYKPEVDPEATFMIRLMRKWLPYEKDRFPAHDGRFFIRFRGKFYLTSLGATLVTLEISDLVFAVDSVPAILSISSDPLIVYTSNIFAILGLRALYFVLAQAMTNIRFLEPALSGILFFIGIKMLGSHFFTISETTTLFTIIAVLTLASLASYLIPPGKTD